MDAIARRKLESLLASLPSGQDRQVLVDAFVGGDVLLGQRGSAEDHARAVLDLIEAEGTDLREVFELLRERHPPLAARIDHAEAVVLPATHDEERPTEMLDAEALQAALQRQQPAPAAPRNLAAAATSAPAPASPPAPAAPHKPAPLPAAPQAPRPALPPPAPKRQLIPTWLVVVVGVGVLGALAYLIAAAGRV